LNAAQSQQFNYTCENTTGLDFVYALPDPGGIACPNPTPRGVIDAIPTPPIVSAIQSPLPLVCGERRAPAPAPFFTRFPSQLASTTARADLEPEEPERYAAAEYEDERLRNHGDHNDADEVEMRENEWDTSSSDTMSDVAPDSAYTTTTITTAASEYTHPHARIPALVPDNIRAAFDQATRVIRERTRCENEAHRARVESQTYLDDETYKSRRQQANNEDLHLLYPSEDEVHEGSNIGDDIYERSACATPAWSPVRSNCDSDEDDDMYALPPSNDPANVVDDVEMPDHGAAFVFHTNAAQVSPSIAAQTHAFNAAFAHNANISDEYANPYRNENSAQRQHHEVYVDQLRHDIFGDESEISSSDTASQYGFENENQTSEAHIRARQDEAIIRDAGFKGLEEIHKYSALVMHRFDGEQANQAVRGLRTRLLTRYFDTLALRRLIVDLIHDIHFMMPECQRIECEKEDLCVLMHDQGLVQFMHVSRREFFKLRAPACNVLFKDEEVSFLRSAVGIFRVYGYEALSDQIDTLLQLSLPDED
ncbi:hypothetical protein BJ138DRAFT_1200389, partial [Hygrophoropsis aurantiaca]